MTEAEEIDALKRLLAWQAAMGADDVCADVAIDWLTRGAAAPGAAFSMPHGHAPPHPAPSPGAPPVSVSRHAPAMSPAPAPTSRAEPGPARPSAPPSAPAPLSRRFPTAAPDAAETAARSSAAKTTSLRELEASLASFEGCGLKATAKHLCFYRGAERARVLVIGEAPGRDEDLEGRPFVGRAGQLLDKMLAAIGLDEKSVHITNIVYWRPPGNRTPTPQEAQVCRPFLERQMELVGPDVVMLMGGAAAKHILETPEGIMRLRGTWKQITVGGRRVKAIATLHPAYLLRTPAAKRLAWRDLLAVRAALQE